MFYGNKQKLWVQRDAEDSQLGTLVCHGVLCNLSADTQYSSLFWREHHSSSAFIWENLPHLWTPRSKSFTGSETQSAASSNHFCPVTQASKKQDKLFPMCWVCVFNTQDCTLKQFILPLFEKIISVKCLDQTWIFPPTFLCSIFGPYCQPFHPLTVDQRSSLVSVHSLLNC